LVGGHSIQTESSQLGSLLSSLVSSDRQLAAD